MGKRSMSKIMARIVVALALVVGGVLVLPVAVESTVAQQALGPQLQEVVSAALGADTASAAACSTPGYVAVDAPYDSAVGAGYSSRDIGNAIEVTFISTGCISRYITCWHPTQQYQLDMYVYRSWFGSQRHGCKLP